MVSLGADVSQGERGSTSAPTVSFDRSQVRATNTVFKSGPLFISSKGADRVDFLEETLVYPDTYITSLLSSDPSALPQKGGEVNLTLGGIDLNNSGSVVVKADKKLLTVLFPNGGDGRGFTLKAETSEDMYEWKAALESALAQAPSANLVMGQNGIFQTDASASDTIEGSFEQWRDRRPVQSLVVGRPILLALEEIDGSPSFLEKALRFIEQHGVKVEGILRQSADVEEVKLRVQEYERGKTEFSPDEDAHVVSDCIKYILRELPSSPVPASCCTALLEAFRIDYEIRIDAMHDAISETLPDPNRRLLQRVLQMMLAVASHKSENRMSATAVAACMAPLLLRPLLAGDCELEDDFDIGVGGSAQLMAAAVAANHAHAIIATLLDEFDNIFEDDCLQRESHSSDMYSDSESNGSEDSMEDEILETAYDGYQDAENDLDPDDDPERVCSGTLSESSGNAGNDLYDFKVYASVDLDADAKNDGRQCSISPKSIDDLDLSLQDSVMENLTENDTVSGALASDCHSSLGDNAAVVSPKPDISLSSSLSLTKSIDNSNGAAPTVKRPAIWGRTAARKNLAMESIDCSSDDEIMIQRLEITKNDLQNKIAKEAKGNAILQASLERRKQALYERRLALEQDVARLQEQLQREKDLRVTIEAGLNMPLGNYVASSTMDTKIRAELEEIALAEADVVSLKHKAADLHLQLNQQHQNIHTSFCESCGQHQRTQKHELAEKLQQQVLGTASGVLLHEGTQKSEDVLLRPNCGTMKTQGVPSAQSRQPHWKRRDLPNASTYSSDLVKESVAQDEGRQSQLLNELHILDGKDRTSLYN